MNQRFKLILRCFLFILIVILLFLCATQILKRKAIEGEFNKTIKINGFYNEAKNTYDVIGFGSSHMYCTINPLSLWKYSGIPSYLLTSQQQPAWTSYYYMKEAIKTQHPKVVIFEAYMLTQNNEYYADGVNYDAIDDIAWSWNKIDLIRSMVPKEKRINYYFNFLKYHSRWSELQNQDFDTTYLSEKDWLKGYVYLKQSKPITIDKTIAYVTDKNPLYEKNQEYLEKIVQLSKDEDFKLLIIISPYSLYKDQQKIFNTVKEYAIQQNINLIDFNALSDEIGLDQGTDFYDYGHLNALGAEKTSAYLAQYLTEKYEFTDKTNDPAYVDFNTTMQKFYLSLDK